jgi:hypothetical protein
MLYNTLMYVIAMFLKCFIFTMYFMTIPLPGKRLLKGVPPVFTDFL